MGQEQNRTADRSKVQSAKRKRLRLILIIVLALAVAATGLVLLLTRKIDLAESVISLPFSANDSYAGYEKGVVYYKDGSVHALDTSGTEIWYTDFEGKNVQLAASSSLVAVYTPSTLHVFNQKGEELFSREFLGTISKVVCSDTMILVCRKTAQGLDISVINEAGADVNTVDMGAQFAVDFGADDDSQMIWILTLDTSADTPVSRISTYTGGSTISGLITIDSQIVTGALFTQAEVYALGSTHVMCYDYKGDPLSSQLIYGWTVEDAQLDKNGKPILVLTPPSKESSNTFSYPMARLIFYGTNETLLHLPPECFRVLLGDNRIYGFTPTAVHVYNVDGQEDTSYPLGITIDRVGRPYSDSHILVFSSQECFLVPLP